MSSAGGALGSGHNLTADREFRYVVQWFTEWSDFQREDFVPVLATYLAQTANPGGPVYVNGIVSGMANISGQDKPMSLFQCRVKLFNEWASKWPESNREKLLERLTEIDPEFGKRVQQELAGEHQNTFDTSEPGMEYYENGGDSSSPNMEFQNPCVTTTTVPEPGSTMEQQQPTPIALVIGED